MHSKYKRGMASLKISKSMSVDYPICTVYTIEEWLH